MNSHIIKDTLYPLVHLSCSTKFLVLGPPALLSQSHIAGSGAWTSGLASESFWLSLNSFQSKKEQKDKQQGLQWAQKLGRPWKKRIGKKVRSRRRERKWGSGRVRKWKRTAWPGKKISLSVLSSRFMILFVLSQHPWFPSRLPCSTQ